MRERYRTKVLLLFGGQSAEHEISVISARSVFQAIDSSKYELILIGISRTGKWFLDNGSGDILKNKNVNGEKSQQVFLGVGVNEIIKILQTDKSDIKFDVVFPLLHGPYGEDGTIQGLLELSGAAYIGAGVAASAIGMDKAIARKIFAHSGLRQTRYLVSLKKEWEQDTGQFLKNIYQRLNYPLFVKPANMGSSIGISKVPHQDKLLDAIQMAEEYDDKVIIEESVELAREIECAILGNYSAKASELGEIVPSGEFYDYTTKYLDDKSQLIVPAELTHAVKENIQDMALRAFNAIECRGLARVDFLLSVSGEVFLNEINTMPGFTPISMFPKLWRASGLTYSDLISELIQLAISSKDKIYYR